MPAIQSLKKQLRGVRSTQKLTKAMRTVSTVKFSRLNGLYAGYAAYGRACRRLLDRFGAVFSESLSPADPEAPDALLVMSSNKGLCGSFNSELMACATDALPRLRDPRVICCGKKAAAFFQGRLPEPPEVSLFSDVPTYGECSALLDTLLERRRAGEISRVWLVYPRYRNMMTQEPMLRELFAVGEGGAEMPDVLLVPDRDTAVAALAVEVFRASFYGLVLESALGAQAATLMTMRSAFDTATEYCASLEGQINRLRQSTVTADVIETSGKTET